LIIEECSDYLEVFSDRYRVLIEYELVEENGTVRGYGGLYSIIFYRRDIPPLSPKQERIECTNSQCLNRRPCSSLFLQVRYVMGEFELIDVFDAPLRTPQSPPALSYNPDISSYLLQLSVQAQDASFEGFTNVKGRDTSTAPSGSSTFTIRRLSDVGYQEVEVPDGTLLNPVGFSFVFMFMPSIKQYNGS